ncbi:MAG: cytochrome c [Rubrivivax sp.]|nr:MAG: cytochrome c [Rubrivivax sp.]
MNPRFKRLITPAVVAALLAVGAGVQAQQGPKPETLIKWRQSAFQVVAWNNGRIKANVDGQYNKDEVIKAANTIAAIANSGLGALFVPGTEQGKGWHDTSAKPELFKNAPRFAELSTNFAKEATELTKVAANGDQAAVKEQFGKLSRTCKACHDDFKSKD